MQYQLDYVGPVLGPRLPREIAAAARLLLSKDAVQQLVPVHLNSLWGRSPFRVNRVDFAMSAIGRLTL